MKAVLLKDFGTPDMMFVGEKPIPKINENQVLIRVHATSVNGPDIMQRLGKYPPPKGDSEILGLEVAGTIEAIGSNVTAWKTGDRVLALVAGGGYAQFVSAWAGHVMPVPQSMSFHEAACICETYLTAYLTLFMLGAFKSGESVLLHGGGGGVNTAGVHLCKNLVSDSVVIVTASPEKLERVQALGADYAIDYKNQIFSEVVREVTGGRGAEVILDHIGAPYLAENMKCLATGGRLLQIGVTGGIKAELNLALMMVRRQQIIGSVLRSRSVEEKSDIISAFNQQVMPLFVKRTIVPLVSNVFPLGNAAEAHQTMQTSQHFGKIVLEVSH